MSLEHKFHQTVKEWREHCRNTPSSLSHSYLDCDAYRRIVAMGAQVLPLIRDQLYIEYEKAMKYEDELKRSQLKDIHDGIKMITVLVRNIDSWREERNILIYC